MMTTVFATLDTISTLWPSDWEMFTQLRIPRDLLIAAGVVRVTDWEARNIYGIKFDPIKDCSGLFFPYYSPVTGYRVGGRLRRDHPEIVNGKVKDKYLTAWGDRPHLYFPPVPNLRELLADLSVLIVLVEAEKSVLAVMEYAKRNGVRLLVIGTGGCWGWHSKRAGSKLGTDGKYEPAPGPIPDLDHCDGHPVKVLLDSNCKTNYKVRWARTHLVAELQKPERSCTVLICDLPVFSEINGPDDYLSKFGDQALTVVLATAHLPTGHNQRQHRPRRSAPAPQLERRVW